jgi:hypothetical protein
MEATLPLCRINENDEEVELGLPWVTDWEAETWTYDGMSLGDGDIAGRQY